MSPGVCYTSGEQRREADLAGHANTVSCGQSGARPAPAAELATTLRAGAARGVHRDQDTLGRVHVLRCAAAACSANGGLLAAH